MRSSIPSLGCICILVLAPCISLAAPTEAVFSDPEGDASPPSNDILETRIKGSDGKLWITVNLAESPVTLEEMEFAEGPETFHNVETGRAVTLYIDSDGDDKTGETPHGWEGPAGFDYDLSLSFCYDVPNEPGCPEGQADAVGGRLHAYLMSMDFSGDSDQEFEIDGLESADFTIELPYDAIGVGAGSSIRIFVDETLNAVTEPEESTVQSVTLD